MPEQKSIFAETGPPPRAEGYASALATAALLTGTEGSSPKSGHDEFWEAQALTALVPAPSRREPDLVRWQLKTPFAVAVCVRLVAVVLDVPVEAALLHAVPAFLASGQSIEKFQKVNMTVPGAEKHGTQISVALPRETWDQASARARSDKVTVLDVLVASMRPYRDRIARVLALLDLPTEGVQS